jgi:hypothetical protein
MLSVEHALSRDSFATSRPAHAIHIPIPRRRAAIPRAVNPTSFEQ